MGQEAEVAAANGMTEPALSLFRDMLREHAPRLSILPSDGNLDPIIQDRLRRYIGPRASRMAAP